MNHEKKIILELLKYDNHSKVLKLMQCNTNWINILGFLTYHRVAGLAHEKMNELNVRFFDYPVYLTTYMINQAQALRSREQNKWINLIAEQLNKKKIKFVFLKGSVLNNTLFKEGSRASNDIDILIQKKSIPLVTNILNQLGFIQGTYNYKTKNIHKFTSEEIKQSILTRGETAPFVKKIDKLEIETIDVDVNFSIDWMPDNDKIVSDFLNNRILITKHDGIPIFALNHYHNLLELCVHLYKDSSLIDIVKKRKVLDLYKFIDIYYYLKKYDKEIKMNILYKEIKKYNLERYLYFSLKCVTEIFPDSKSLELDALIKKIEDENILNIIFSQENPKNKMKTDTTIIDRIFSYDVINKYRRIK